MFTSKGHEKNDVFSLVNGGSKMSVTKYLKKIIVPQNVCRRASPHELYQVYLSRPSQKAFLCVEEYDDCTIERMMVALHNVHPTYSFKCYGDIHRSNAHYIRSWVNRNAESALVIVENFARMPRHPSPEYRYVINTYYKDTYIVDAIWHTKPLAIQQRISNKGHVTFAGTDELK